MSDRLVSEEYIRELEAEVERLKRLNSQLTHDFNVMLRAEGESQAREKMLWEALEKIESHAELRQQVGFNPYQGLANVVRIAREALNKE